MAIVLNPATGLKDVTQFPSKPASGAAARNQIQSIIDQVINQANSELAAITNTALYGSNGWFKDKKTGIIIQWGAIAMSNLTSQSATFPITFPNATFDIAMSNLTNDATYIANRSGATTSGFTVYANKASTAVITYIAIGY
jgi:hypothetical protein